MRARHAARQTAANLYSMWAGLRFSRKLPSHPGPLPSAPTDGGNPLEDYFDSVTEGPGIWKWRHYFPIYHRHLAKFVGAAVHVVEIGVYSGGSLRMWRDYFGPESRIYGVDIEPVCRAYEEEGIRVFTGDQADPAFWKRFRSQIPRVDVVVDDGGHEPHQQITTLQSLLPHMTMGGVYICEDIIGVFQRFQSFVDGLTRPLNSFEGSRVQPVHRHVASVHRYPGVTVIEKPDHPVESFDVSKRGTEWAGIYG